ncbi:NHLP bacteriocin export ABC transporter permease/ATPase subunit [Caenimonas terrae]|uniref:NHLP bacteriocin export ABC transporter permease/ATPase subunit n=1 Tax=Caenimonas terrae TaxID=696074 RepID=A0ABW0NAK3_9BURK
MSSIPPGFDLFHSQGTQAQGRTGDPLLLQGRENVWLVAEGRVDVFLVRLRDNRSDDAFHPLFRVDAGELLFGLPPASPLGWGLVAVGAPGHKLLRLDRAGWAGDVQAHPECIAAAAAALDLWMARLVTPLIDSPPQGATAIEAGQQYTVAANQLLLAAGSVWLGARETHLRFLNLESAPIEPAAGTLFPVPPSGWVAAATAGTMSTAGTAALLGEAALWPGLDTFHGMVQSCLIARTLARERLEAERLARKMGHEGEYLDRAMHALAAVLDRRAAAGPPESASASIASALRLVGGAAGFTVTVPPAPAASQATGRRDEVAEIAEASLIRRRAVALKGQWWTTGAGPLLGFREEGGQPVALLPTRGGYMLHDPATGERSPVGAELANTLSPFAFSFYRSFPHGKMKLLDLMKFGSHGLVRDYLLVGLMGLTVGVLGMLTPILTGLLFDTVIPGADRGQLSQVTLALLAGAFGAAMFELTKGFAMLRAESRMDASIQAGVWDRLLRLPAPFFRDFSAGDLAVRANGINAIRQALSGTTLSAIFSAVFSVFNLLLLFYYNAKLALVALALVLVAVLFMVGVNLVALRQQRRLAELSGLLSGMVFQFLGGISKLRTTGSETRAFHQWAVQFAAQQRYQFRAQMAQNAMATFGAVFPVLANIALFGMIAIYLQDAKDFSTGQFLAFNAAFGGLMGAMLAATGALTSILNIIPIYERAKPILRGEPEITSSKAHPGQLTGEIEINHLSFSYAPDGPQILKDVSLQIKPGEFVALVGASGSGKSTLLRLLLGFETPTLGSIFYDRQDMAGLDLGALRRQLGVVLQNGQLLAGDVFTNIIGSAAALTLDDAWDAATQAGIADDIRDMPMGMHTVVSDGGGTLSGGQRQRVLIARAIVNRPRIVIFDEATSALDNRAQAMVSDSLEKLQATRIVIAHRLSTIVNADRILVLDNGNLVQSGTYAALMEQPGIFAELARRQIT